MASFDSRITIESTTAPGVTFVLRKMSAGRRIEYNEKAVALDEAHRKALLHRLDIEGKSDLPAFQAYIDAVKSWSDGKGPLPVPPEGYNDWLDARDREREADERRMPILLKWGLASVTGLTLNGNDSPSIDDIIEEGPEELTKEIAFAIRSHKDIPADLAKNSQSPSTLVVLEGGKTQNTTATPAKSADATSSATAPSSSQLVSA